MPSFEFRVVDSVEPELNDAGVCLVANGEPLARDAIRIAISLNEQQIRFDRGFSRLR